MKPMKRAPKRPSPQGRNDTLVSAAMLDAAVDAILQRVHLDRTYDIPYLAGYSLDGRTIYIDRHVPRTFVSSGRRVKVDPFLILHEAVEKSILDGVGLHYQHAHQIALRAEEAAVRAMRVSWREYDRFMQQQIKEVDDERLIRIPPNLDIKPYRDEKDFKQLHRMRDAIAREAANGKRRKGR
jgi:hypothetical protein